MNRHEQLELLRRHAPILRFDDRELFFPIAVDGYVSASSLWDGDVEIAAAGELSIDQLDDRFAPSAHLRIVSDHDRRSVVKAEAQRLARRLLTPRLGRVGLFGRVLDALFLLSVFFRPTTPSSTTTATALKTERLGFHDRPVCYGRVVEAGEWLVLHYAYFYAMNDWRSGYRGLNDHEADWEQAWIYLDPAGNQPIWVAASSHDYHGGDLRRHWDDPELLRNDTRPVLHPGAGSHALYFRPGDYVTRIDVPALRPLLQAQRWLQRALRIRDEATERGLGPALGAPFVDSAGGDGREVLVWDVQPMLEDDGEEVPWVGRYRGLWGLDTHDPLGGERGPSGPKFTRDGDIRVSWADPIGFAGLHGNPPPSAAGARINAEKFAKALADLDEQIKRRGRLLPLAEQTANPGEMEEESERMSELLRQRTELEDVSRRIARKEQRALDLRAHIENPAVPLPPPRGSGWLLAAWAAASIPMILLSIAAVILFDTVQLAGITVVVGAVAVLGEQLVRRQFHALLRLAILFALITAFFLFVVGGVITVSRYVIGVALVAGAVLLFVANLGELGAVRNARSRAEGPGRRPPPEHREAPQDGPPAGRI